MPTEDDFGSVLKLYSTTGPRTFEVDSTFCLFCPKLFSVSRGFVSNYRKIIIIENVHLISSDKHCSKNKSERVFHILNQYEFALENSAKS